MPPGPRLRDRSHGRYRRLTLAAGSLLLAVAMARAQSSPFVRILAPVDGTIYPPDFSPPAFVWLDAGPAAPASWNLEIRFAANEPPLTIRTSGARLEPGRLDGRAIAPTNAPPQLSPEEAAARSWRPSREQWAEIQRRAGQALVTLIVSGRSGAARGQVSFRISRDPVGAPIFFRDVPLMPSDLEQGVIKPLVANALPLVEWRLRYVDEDRSRLLLTGLTTCANCHSFSRDGKTLGIDVDGPQNDKGMYALARVQPRMSIRDEDVLTWNSYPGKPERQNTLGFMSQVSPDGRYAITTLNEEVYVANFKDYRFLQVFYPTRGILGYYDRETGRIQALPGADDPRYVHTSATWSPDGTYLVFSRAEARDAYPAGRPVAQRANDPGELPMRYDLYRIPFHEGRGGTAEPVPGAAANGKSNSFPKISPDGRWIVFVQARNGLLMRPDSELFLVPASGGVARRLTANLPLMNSWHSFSPNGRWLVFTSKSHSPYTRMYLTHIDEEGNDSPAIPIENATAANRAVNIPEFVNIGREGLTRIQVPAVDFFRLVDRAWEQAARGDLASSLNTWQKALQLAPDDARAHNGYGVTLARAGRNDEAMAEYSEAIRLDPRLAEAHNNVGVLLSARGRDEDAAAAYRRAVEAKPNYSQAHYNLGRIALRQGRRDEALQSWRRAVEIAPDTPELRSNLAALLFDTGAWNEAAQHWRGALQLQPGLASAHFGLGNVLYLAGDIRACLAEWRAGLAVDSGDAPALNQLARVLATSTDDGLRNGKEALVFATRAAGRAKQDPAVLDTLAAAYAECGRFSEAAATARRASGLARGAGNAPLAGRLLDRALLYESGKPLRESHPPALPAR